jgi:hypothetical protein
MARMFRFSINRNGAQSASTLNFDSGEFGPECYFDGINAFEIELENENNRGLRLTFNKNEARKIFQELNKHLAAFETEEVDNA